MQGREVGTLKGSSRNSLFLHKTQNESPFFLYLIPSFSIFWCSCKSSSLLPREENCVERQEHCTQWCVFSDVCSVSEQENGSPKISCWLSGMSFRWKFLIAKINDWSSVKWTIVKFNRGVRNLALLRHLDFLTC